MSAAVARNPVPKRKDGPKRNDAPAKVDAEIVRDAKIVAACRDITLAEYLSELIRPLVARDLEAELSRRAKASRPRKEGGKA